MKKQKFIIKCFTKDLSKSYYVYSETLISSFPNDATIFDSIESAKEVIQKRKYYLKDFDDQYIYKIEELNDKIINDIQKQNKIESICK